MRTALGILVFTMLAAGVALFLYSGRGEIRTITTTTSTSDCIGDPKTPTCALDTFIACGTRKDPGLCAVSVVRSRGEVCAASNPADCYRRPMADAFNPAFYRIDRIAPYKGKLDEMEVELFYWRCKQPPSQSFAGRAGEAWRRAGGFVEYADFMIYTTWIDVLNAVSKEPIVHTDAWVYPHPLRDRCWTARYGYLDKVDGTWRVAADEYGPEVDQLGHWDYDT